MQLGDTSQFAQYAADPRFAGYSFVQDPNSIFAQLARQESKGLEDIDLGANVGNTFFSGMRNRDRQEFSDETGRQRLAGSTSFQDDLKAYAASLGLSEGQYRQAMADADQMDIDAALERDRIAREQFDREEQQRADEAAAAAAAAPQVTASAPQAGTPAPTTITQVSPSTPGHPGVYVQDHGPRAGLQYIIKDGVKWYESKKGKKDWGKGGKIGMTP